MKIAQNFTILYWFRKNATGTNGKKPLYCRLTLNGQRSELSLGICVDEKNFNKDRGFMKGYSTDAQQINATLDETRHKLRRIHQELSGADATVTVEMIRDAYLGKSKKESQRTLLEAITWHNEIFSQKVKSGSRAHASLAKFETTKSKVRAFIKWHYKTADIPLISIKASFADDFEHYLIVKDSLKQNSVMKYMRCLKKVLIMAVQKEWLVRNPIGGYKCTYTNPERNFLLMEDLTILMNKKLSVKRLEEVRDCFVFMCYTGFAFQDAASLSPENIKLMIDGERWLSKPRIKTNVKQNVPILPVAESLIEKYRHHPYCHAHGKLLPFNSNQKMNAYLKEIGDLCEIPFPLTTHLARHTFATSVTLANGVPLETVKELLGHRNIRTTHIYAKVLSHKVSEDMKLLKVKLAEPKRAKTKEG